MKVCVATMQDFDRLQDLYYAASLKQAAAAEDYYVAAYQDHYLFAGIVELSDGDVLVAEDEGRAVGMAIVSVSERPMSPNVLQRRYVCVSSLIFETDEARDMLIAEAELWAFARNIDYLQVRLHAEDENGAKLYTGMGFSPEMVLLSRQIPREASPIGLPRGNVKLYPHCREWELEGVRTVAELKQLLQGVAVFVTHVGSTSIPSIPAKPIIDVAVAVRDFDLVLEKQELLRQHGYHYRPSVEDLGRQLLFAKGSFYEGTGDLQTHFIHVVKLDSYEWWDYENFRCYLTEFNDVAIKYAELKLRLARANPTDNGREKYLAGKRDFIQDILEKASKYYNR